MSWQGQKPPGFPRFPIRPGQRDPQLYNRATVGGQGDPLIPGSSGGPPAQSQNGEPDPVPIDFPRHLYPPYWASTLDIKTVASIDPGTTLNLITFVAPQGAITKLLSYAIFNDGALAINFDFFPKIDGRRIYPYHGDPLTSNPIGTSGFRIYLGVNADLDDASLINAYTEMQPGQVLTWDAQNRDVVSAVMGVRVVGYVDQTKRTQGKSGG